MDTALVAAATSLGVSVGTAVINYVGHVRIARRQDLLDAGREDRNALRDYRYEALKRLYVEVQPVMFQLAEGCQLALARILDGIVGGARQGLLTQAGRLGVGWEGDPNHMTTTVWALFGPLALIRAERRLLTGLDLSLDARMRWQHTLAVALNDVWMAGEEMGAIRPALTQEWNDPIARQYLLRGSLERVIDEITPGPEAKLKYLPDFADIHDRLIAAKPGSGLNRASLLLTAFHPTTKPVLWRILIAQAHIHAALIQTLQTSIDDDGTAELDRRQLIHPLDAKATANWTVFDWRIPGEGVSDTDVRADVEAARSYLESHIPRPWLAAGKSS